MSAQFWDERYGQEEYAYGREPNDFVREQAHRIPKGRVLCLGEGEGRNAVYLASLGHDVTAVDFSEKGLAKGAALARERGVKVSFVHADLAHYEIEPGAYAGIVATFAHLPPDLRARVHAQAARGLAPGGCFVLEAYTPAQLAYGKGGPRDVKLLMTLEDLKRELSPLRLEIAQEITRQINEGPFHGGTSAVVQIVAVA